MALPPKLRGSSNAARLGRVNRRISGLKRRERRSKSGGVNARLTARIGRLEDRRGVLQGAVKEDRRKARSREVINMLSDPTKVASGNNLRAMARAAERATSIPAISQKRNYIEQLRRSRDRDVAKLQAMGGRLDEQVKGISGKMDEYGREAYANAVNTNKIMNDNLQANLNRATDHANRLQSQVLGQQISTLTGNNADPANSATTKAGGEFAAMQDAAINSNAAAWSELANKMGQANLMTTEAGTTAAKNSLNNQAIAIQRGIATRASDRMFQGSQDIDTAGAELATLKGLRGAEFINQLMKLRGTERDFISQKEQNATDRYVANTQAANDRRKLAIQQYGEETDRINALNDGSSSGGSSRSTSSSADDNDQALSRSEWRQGRAAANDYLSNSPNGRVTNWSKFLDKVESAEGLSWTPMERARFKRRYKNYLANR